MAERLKEKSIADVCEWLEQKGFDDVVVEAIRGKGYTAN